MVVKMNSMKINKSEETILLKYQCPNQDCAAIVTLEAHEIPLHPFLLRCPICNTIIKQIAL
ncbi:MAG TPA: hypothetical protein VMV49_10265 [Candidatus Deferrimicrobium sp.]|nr:hypothetical protein [Candidatus Deferrimicrobium sp.]